MKPFHSFNLITLFILIITLTTVHGQTSLDLQDLLDQLDSSIIETNGDLFKQSEPKPVEVLTSTVYRTIIFTSSAVASPTIYTMNNPAGHQQESTTAVHEDQKVLKRMTLILSLVGGLGGAVILTTAFVLIRLYRKRSDRPLDREEQPAIDKPLTVEKPPSLFDERQDLTPSAPPAPPTLYVEPYIPSASHSAGPVPSAPTIKDLGSPGLTTISPDLPPPAYSVNPLYSPPPLRRHSIGT